MRNTTKTRLSSAFAAPVFSLELDGRAFAQAGQIFAKGQPGKGPGQSLLAHELAHTAQNRSAAQGEKPTYEARALAPEGGRPGGKAAAEALRGSHGKTLRISTKGPGAVSGRVHKATVSPGAEEIVIVFTEVKHEY